MSTALMIVMFKGADLVGNLARNTVTSIKVMQC
jgi:hypothetical protein